MPDVTLVIREEETFCLCMIPFPQIISNRNHVMLDNFEWGPKRAQIIPAPVADLVVYWLHIFNKSLQMYMFQGK